MLMLVRNQTLLDLHKDLLVFTTSTASSSRRPEPWTDETTETSLVALVLGRIVTNKDEEEVAEVKNAAISWCAFSLLLFEALTSRSLGVMSRKCRAASLKKIVETLLSGLSSSSDEQRDVACMGELTPSLHSSAHETQL